MDLKLPLKSMRTRDKANSVCVPSFVTSKLNLCVTLSFWALLSDGITIDDAPVYHSKQQALTSLGALLNIFALIMLVFDNLPTDFAGDNEDLS